MKKMVFTLIIMCMAFGAWAQVDTSQQYFKSPTIPAFNVRKVPDSSSFTNSLLQNNKPTVLIFFDPDCDHCQQATKNIIAKIDQLKDVQILMIAIVEFKFIKKFYTNFKIVNYPNITITRDATYDLPRFYGIHSIPDVYVYDKKGKFLNHFKKDIPVDEIIALF